MDLIRQIPLIYTKAAIRAADETGLPPSGFSPAEISHTTAAHLDRILDGDFLPNQMDGLYCG